jgi:hypothetical protein
MASVPPNALSRFSHRLGEIKRGITTLALGAASLALALAPLFLLFWLMQPKVLANPGIGALRVAQAASWEPFLQESSLRESSQSAEPPRQESPVRLDSGPQYRQPKTSAKRELRASNGNRTRLAQKRRTMASPLPQARRHERQGSSRRPRAEGTG